MRALRSIAALLLAITWAVAPGWAQTESAADISRQAEELLRRVAETYGGLETFYFEATEVTETRSGDLERTTEGRLVTAADSSGRSREEMFDQINNIVVIFDGRTRWVYLPEKQEYKKNTLASFAEAGSESVLKERANASKSAKRYPLRYSGAATNLVGARLLGREAIRVSASDRNHAVVQAEYETPPGVQKGEVHRTYWINEERFLVAREVSVAEMSRSGTNTPVKITQTISFLDVKVNEEVPDDVFTFVPPAGAELAEEFVPAQERWAGRPAPNITLPDLAGTSHSLADFRGKVVLLDFWATWCTPCRIDLPHIEALHQQFGSQGLAVFGVNSEGEALAGSFLDEQGYSFPSLVDRDQRVSGLYEVESLPTVIIIDRQGTVASYLVGLQTDEHLRAELAKLGIQ